MSNPVNTEEETRYRNILVTKPEKRGHNKIIVRNEQGNALINPATQMELNMFLTSTEGVLTSRDVVIIRLRGELKTRVALTCYGIPLTVLIEKGRTNMFLATLIFRLLADWTEQVEWTFQTLLVFRKRTPLLRL